jgi:hypothetical protein
MKTLGEFYREKVLSSNPLEARTLPIGGDEVRVEKDLFGWKLLVDGRAVLCRSEEEARLLRVFCDAGMTEVSVPQDDEYLKSILPELERLKSRTDEIIKSYLDSILDRGLRDRLRHEVFAELTK